MGDITLGFVIKMEIFYPGKPFFRIDDVCGAILMIDLFFMEKDMDIIAVQKWLKIFFGNNGIKAIIMVIMGEEQYGRLGDAIQTFNHIKVV